jgi:hypothetical protein
MVYNTQNYWVFGIFPSSGILENTTFRKLDLFPSSGEDGGEDTYSVRQFTNLLEKFQLLGRDATVIAYRHSRRRHILIYGIVSFLQMAVVMGLQIREVREI